MSSAGFRTTVLPQTSAGASFHDGNRDREVPRRDRADDADRHAHRHVELVLELRRRRLPPQPAALAGHVVGHVDRFLDVAARLGLDLPHLVGHQVGERRLLALEDLREAVEDLAALRRGHEPPVLVGGLRLSTARRPLPRRPPGRCRATSPVAGLRLSRVFVSVATETSLVATSGASVSGNVPGMRGRRRSRVSRFSTNSGSGLPVRAVGTLAAVDDDRHVRVVLVVVDHLVVELVGELPRNHAIDHRGRIVVRRGRRALEARDLGNEPALVLDVGVPRLERLLELVELVAAALEPHRLRRTRG